MSDGVYSFPLYLLDIVDKDWVTDMIEIESIDMKSEYQPNTLESENNKKNVIDLTKRFKNIHVQSSCFGAITTFKGNTL